MNSMIEILIVGVVLIAALAYLVRRTYRRWRGARQSCESGCSCGSDSTEKTLLKIRLD